MDDVTQIIRDAPLAALVPLVLLIVVGLLLWAAGQRVLRAAFAAAGLAVGGAAGWAIGTGWNLGITPWVVAAVAALLAACVGVLVYRAALAAALALVCGLAAPASVLTVAELQSAAETRDEPAATLPVAETPPPRGNLRTRIDAANDWLFRPLLDEGAAAPAEDEPATPVEEAALRGLGLSAPAADRVAAAEGRARRVADAARTWWDGTPQSLRPALIAAAIAGGLAGLLLGTLAPMVTATIVSAFGGSLLSLAGLRLVLAHFLEPTVLPDSATFALALWLIISLIGIAIQWTFRPKQADTGR